MSACRAEHHGHGHGHSHGSGDGHEGHDHDDPERGFEESLYPFVDQPNVTCGNEETVGSGKLCLRPWSERLDASKFVLSDADEQLLFFIPFTANVKIKSIRLIYDNDDSRPTKMKAFKNREGVDFDMAETLPALQEWDLVEISDLENGLAYETRVSQFQGIHSVTLFFPENNGADETRLRYIGFSGEATHVVRRTIIKIAETAANPADHKTKTGSRSNASMTGY